MDIAKGSIKIDQERHVPLVVVGGGLAGLCAAIAAARLGTRVALVQERSVLGGNSSSEIRVHPVGASQHGYHRDARETGLIEEIFLEVRASSYGLRQVNGQHYPMWDVVLAEKAEAEPNLELFLNTRVVAVETEDNLTDGYTNRITALVASQQGTERNYRLTCDAVVDATGDGFVALQAGAPFRYGREARAEFDESWAPEEADDVVLGSTIMFAARDVGRPVPFIAPSWAHVFPDEDSLPFRNHGEFASGYWWIEWGGRLNTIADNESIRRELHAAVFGVWDHIKNHCTLPGVRERAATWVMDWIGHTPGKRESRRFEGDYILRERDILDGLAAVPFDVVAHGGWPIDLHAPDGVYSPDRPCTQPPLPGLYGIPLRSLYSRTVANLFLAGRDISQTHVAHGSTRVMKTCAAIGQASGTAAAFAVHRGSTPRALIGDAEGLLRATQQRLLREGVYLPLIRNEDECDLARRPGVRVTATSEATLRLDVDGQESMGWEHLGLSTAERHGLIAERMGQDALNAVALDAPAGQAIVVSSGQIDQIVLRLRSNRDRPVPVRLHLRQAAQLRDFGPLDGNGREFATIEGVVAPGENLTRFRSNRPIVVARGQPVVLVMEAQESLSWVLSPQEPPGTQAARWDRELGYWRWMHGSLWFAVAPESVPYGAANVVSGVTRPDVGTNVWISDPAQPLPQSIELTWPEPVTAASIELTFDSQLSGWIWEGHFPLIARDYAIEGRTGVDGSWQTLVEETGNFQRRRVYTVEPREIDALRVTVAATNGGRTARIVEVRVYPPES
ncbi:MAG: FAD-dependent oxidoreductase [Thermomicrobiales bacterium]